MNIPVKNLINKFINDIKEKYETKMNKKNDTPINPIMDVIHSTLGIKLNTKPNSNIKNTIEKDRKSIIDFIRKLKNSDRETYFYLIKNINYILLEKFFYIIQSNKYLRESILEIRENSVNEKFSNLLNDILYLILFIVMLIENKSEYKSCMRNITVEIIKITIFLKTFKNIGIMNDDNDILLDEIWRIIIYKTHIIRDCL